MSTEPTEKRNLRYAFKHVPDLDDLRSWIARERGEEALYRLADIIKHAWSTSISECTVHIEFDKEHFEHALYVEEFLWLIRRLGKLLDEETDYDIAQNKTLTTDQSKNL